MLEFFVLFDCDVAYRLVWFKSVTDIRDQIEDAISSYVEAHPEFESDDLVSEVMNSFDVEWQYATCRVYRI